MNGPVVFADKGTPVVERPPSNPKGTPVDEVASLQRGTPVVINKTGTGQPIRFTSRLIFLAGFGESQAGFGVDDEIGLTSVGVQALDLAH